MDIKKAAYFPALWGKGVDQVSDLAEEVSSFGWFMARILPGSGASLAGEAGPGSRRVRSRILQINRVSEIGGHG